MDIKAPDEREQKSIEILCCYAHKDQQLLLELTAHLAPLQREGLITLWADTNINAGVEWENEIHWHLNTAQIILLLVSSDFIASDYCYSTEMKRAIERHEAGEARVIPIILRPVYFRATPFGRLQTLPKEARPVNSSHWHSQDEAFLNIVEGIRRIIEEIELQKHPNRLLIPKSFIPVENPQQYLVADNELFTTPEEKSQESHEDHSPTLSQESSVSLPISPLPPDFIYRDHSKGDYNSILTIEWSPDGIWIVSTDDHGRVHLWDTTTGKNIFAAKVIGRLDVVKCSPNAKSIAFGDGSGIEIWDVTKMIQASYIKLDPEPPYPKGSLDFTIWEMKTRSIKAKNQPSPLDRENNPFLTIKLKGFSKAIGSMAWSQDNKRIAVGLYDGTVHIRDAATNGNFFIYRGHASTEYGIHALAWSPNGKHIASGGYDKTVQIWDATTGEHSFTYHGHTSMVTSLAWSPDGKRIASASQHGEVYIWDTTKGIRASIYRDDKKGFMSGITWSPNGKYIAFDRHPIIVEVWDTIANKNYITYEEHPSRQSIVKALAWSPDSRRIASSLGDGIVKVWQV